MRLTILKNAVLPSKPRFVRIFRGPFRGAHIYTVPRDNLRKMFGLYEHVLNRWLEKVLRRVDSVIDVGANDGYFTFGCSAAFQRQRRHATILSFEPQLVCCERLEATLRAYPARVDINIVQSYVGKTVSNDQITLDEAWIRFPSTAKALHSLIKIDVEGAELDVIEGARRWLNDANYFLIEVHREEYLEILVARFAAAGLSLERRDPTPLPLIGAELRPNPTWWLVTALV
jgi:Methyltransferase FkbM domain